MCVWLFSECFEVIIFILLRIVDNLELHELCVWQELASCKNSSLFVSAQNQLWTSFLFSSLSLFYSCVSSFFVLTHTPCIHCYVMAVRAQVWTGWLPLAWCQDIPDRSPIPCQEHSWSSRHCQPIASQINLNIWTQNNSSLLLRKGSNICHIYIKCKY